MQLKYRIPGYNLKFKILIDKNRVFLEEMVLVFFIERLLRIMRVNNHIRLSNRRVDL